MGELPGLTSRTPHAAPSHGRGAGAIFAHTHTSCTAVPGPKSCSSTRSTRQYVASRSASGCAASRAPAGLHTAFRTHTNSL